jgi:ABC-2 type transport system ATP-binding protein
MLHPLLHVDDVVKRFSTVTAVDHVSFDVAPGEILALLGPNGAGKTTLVRMLTGILEPDSGSVAWALDGTVAEPDRTRLGFLPEERGLYQDVPILRTLAYFGQLRGMSQADASRAGREWLERLGLADRANDLVKTLSKGNQQKVQFAAAVLHRPRVAILDEPFSGLDPLNQELFLDLVRALRDAGATVLLSAHQMDLVERLADRLVLMNRGRRVEAGTVDELRARWGAGQRLVIHYASGDPSPLELVTAVESLEPRGDGAVLVRVRPGASMSELLAAAARCLEIERVHSEQVRLHEIYVTLMGGGSAAKVEEVAS